ncbi:6070_t:CDS:2, partial [Cetraspora pellucida]
MSTIEFSSKTSSQKNNINEVDTLIVIDLYFKAYSQKLEFTVIKKRVEHRDDVTTFVDIHNYDLHPKICKYSAKFWIIGDDALNNIEFYTKNGNLSITIQHQLLKAKYSGKTFLDTDLANAIQHFKIKSKDLKSDVSQLLTFLTEKIISVRNEMFPAIDQVLSKYLTLYILSVEYIEMAQCLYFSAMLSNLEAFDLSNEKESVNDKFIEDLYDMRQILLELMVAKVSQDNIREIWQINDKRPGNNKKTHFIIIIDSVSYLCTCMFNISQVNTYFSGYCTLQLFLDNTSITIGWVSYYNDSITLVLDGKKDVVSQSNVVFLAVQCDNNEMAQWLKSFIDQKKQFLKNNKKTNHSEQENLAVANPLVTKCKSRPEAKRYKFSAEKARWHPYACHTCGQTGHNSAR